MIKPRKAAKRPGRTTLETRVEQRTRQLRRLAFELARAEESERQSIARDLHDDLGQLLAVAKLHIGRLKAGQIAPADRERILAESEELITRAERSVRSLAFQLSPAVLYELGLVPALQWLADEMQKTYGLTVEITDDSLPKVLSQPERAILFRAIRELLINVLKHAGVSMAYVGTRRVDEQIQVTVRDDGSGFSPARDSDKTKGGFGLASVRERLLFVGGSVEISSVQGAGTEITLTAPLQAESTDR